MTHAFLPTLNLYTSLKLIIAYTKNNEWIEFDWSFKFW